MHNLVEAIGEILKTDMTVMEVVGDWKKKLAMVVFAAEGTDSLEICRVRNGAMVINDAAVTRLKLDAGQLAAVGSQRSF